MKRLIFKKTQVVDEVNEEVVEENQNQNQNRNLAGPNVEEVEVEVVTNTHVRC
jgi:hypothetical protein